jgi:hypothetical protein
LPGNRVAIGAAQPVATAQARIFDPQLERWHGIVLADFLSGQLINGDAEICLRPDARIRSAQVCGRGARVIGRRGTAAVRSRMCQIADHGDTFSIGFQRLENLRKLPVRSFTLRRPLVHGRAMRVVDRAEANLGRGSRGLGRGSRKHGFQERQGDCHTGALKECAS